METSTAPIMPLHVPAPQVWASKSEEMQTVSGGRSNEGLPNSETNEEAAVPKKNLLAPPILPTASLVPKLSSTTNIMSSDDDAMAAGMPLIREALKLETSRNPKAATLIHRLNRVRLSIGQARWNHLRQPYPLDITYQEVDFNTLRRQFLSLYDEWQMAVHPPLPPPHELTGTRPRPQRASIEASNLASQPAPLPVALQDTATPANQPSSNIPGSAWLSSAGQREWCSLASSLSPHSLSHQARSLVDHRRSGQALHYLFPRSFVQK
ncbi:hypothetical protein BJ508DRAFT_314744 [Ascobolus immersus RN42]|uniref:Uncharacterized protein n=1 Tax=Ascobolus immersus RN42 TaxID=1160509 RepID=A0A3N4HDT0_ASCIM|nr:hypothetical protein BJ508DRAFT_314744 [Ascobolus immersus RN42]